MRSRRSRSRRLCREGGEQLPGGRGLPLGAVEPRRAIISCLIASSRAFKAPAWVGELPRREFTQRAGVDAVGAVHLPVRALNRL